jgi:hypothetical protein
VDGATVEGLLPELESWLTGSPRFRAFAIAHEAKVRKKLRGAADSEALRDVRLELVVARLLLDDRRIDLAWERYGSGRIGPDFTLAIAGHRPVNLELTRLRRAPELADAGVPWIAKLRQLPPSTPNAVVVAIDGDSATALDIATSTRLVRARADAKDETYFETRGFADSRTFYGQFLRLGGVFVWCEDAPAGERVTLWRNPSARIAIPDAVARACLACLSSGAT